MISSALRTLRILEHVGQARRPIGVTELAGQLELSPGTVFRGLNALENSGYVERYQLSSNYVLGPIVHQLQRSLLARFMLRDFSLPYLDQIAFGTGETVSLSMPIGWYSVRLAAVTGASEVTNSAPIGEVAKLEQTCAGRAILAELPHDSLERYLAWTLRGGTSQARLELLGAELATTKARGFAIEETSFAPGRAWMARAVRRNAVPIGAIAIEGPVVALEQAGFEHDLKEWIDIILSLEQVVADASDTVNGRFAHLDPDSIHLHVD